MTEAAEPVLLTSKPRNVWLVASLRLALENYAYLPDQPCVSQEPFGELVARVRWLRQHDPTAVIVVSLHWGGEHTLRPVPRQRLDAHQLVDAGADVLICHHTHTLQTIEDYRGHKIFYSIGNFIFDQQNDINTKACMVRLRVGPTTISVDSLPVMIRRCVPCLE